MRSVLLLAIAASVPIGPVAILDAPVPDGFEFASEPPVELTFEEYAQLAHDSVEHVDTESTSARDMTAAVDVWTAGADDILLREVTRWGDESAAAAFVEQAAVLAIEQDFDDVDPPVAGGVAFATSSAGLWSRTATWQQGRFAVTVEHFSLAENDGRVVRETAVAIRDEIATATGRQPVESADDVIVTADEGESSVAMVVLGVAAIALSVFLILRFMRRLRRRPATPADDDEFDVDDLDDVIERTRARTRARRDVDRASFPDELS